MSQYRAALLAGPRGPFAVVELTEGQQRQLSADDRQALTGCVRKQHGTIPVVFVTASPSTLHAIHGDEMTVDLQECLSCHRHDAVPWLILDHGTTAAPPASV